MECTLGDIEDLEECRWKALIAGDRDVLDRLLSDDMVYTHSTGRVDGKESYLEAVTGGFLRYRGVRKSDVVVRKHGSVAVLTGRADIDVTINGEDICSVARFSAVWCVVGTVWQFVCWHSSPIRVVGTASR